MPVAALVSCSRMSPPRRWVRVAYATPIALLGAGVRKLEDPSDHLDGSSSGTRTVAREREVNGIVERVLGLSGAAAYVTVGLLAFAECGTLLGLVLPGELAVMLGGVLAFEGGVSLPAVLIVAAASAVAGDSAGYLLGCRYGNRLLANRSVSPWLSCRIDRAQAYLREKGPAAVFLGRWTSVLRTLVPPLAGSAGMAYKKFVPASIAGGVSWATTFVLLGYVAGASWRRVERVAGRASLLLLLLLAVALLTRWSARALIARRNRVVRRARQIVELPWVQRLATRYRSQLEWLASRFDPRLARGLALTAALAVISAGIWILGEVVHDRLAEREFTLVDTAVARWLAAYREPVALAAARLVVAPLRWPWALVTVGTAAVAGGLIDHPRRAVRIAAAGAGALAAAELLATALPETAGSTRFPADAVALACALAVQATALAGHVRSWTTAIRAAAVGAFMCVAVALAALVDGHAALSGVLAGAALGVTWGAVLEVNARLWQASLQPP